MSTYFWIDDPEPLDKKESVVDISKRLVANQKTNLEPKYIRCKDCDASFLFSEEEQRFFADKKLKHTPSRCHNCRVLRRTQSKTTKRKTVTAVVCISCKCLTYVPFKPKGHSPVYCRYCMYKKKSEVV